MGGSTIIDVDTPVTETPDVWTSRVPATMQDPVPRIDPDAKKRLAYMDAMGTRAMVMSPNEWRGRSAGRCDALSARPQLRQEMNRNAGECGKRERHGSTARSGRCR